IVTRSIDKPVPGIDELVTLAKERIKSGLVAYDALDRLRRDRSNAQLRATLDAHAADLGYALLLKRFRADVTNATPEEIDRAAQSTIPDVPVLFWSFRFMVGIAFWLVALFAFSFYLSARRRLDRHRWYLWAALLSLPLPWIAAELGWIV